ncbi:MAG: 2Fe-2S iron-sulfur cluster-binding protein [Synechococcus sp.]
MQYTIRFVEPAQGTEQSVAVEPGENILDAADEQGVDLPYSCRAGKCVSCIGRIVSGTVEQDHDFLKPNELDAGFVLTCMAHAKTDCVIHTHQEDALFDL